MEQPYCFMQLTFICHAVYVEITIQYCYYTVSVEQNYKGSITWSGCIFSLLCPGHTCKAKPILIS